jgi:hypothetical protein
MATNLKGKGRFASILLLHGEKIAIGIVGVVALWFIYRSFKVDKLPDNFQADKLANEITQTSTEIQSYTWDKALADDPTKVKKAQSIKVSGKFNLDPKDYENRDASGKPVFGVDAPIVAPIILRTDPLILNVVDVRATGGSGLFAFVDEEIRKAQTLKRAQEEQEAAKKAADKAKKEALKGKESAGPGGARKGRNPEGPGAGVNEPIDPDHPKRRLVQNSFRPTGNMLQGGERIERAYWACVVAKVPIREQLKLYQDAFEKARGADPTRDFPSYLGFFVERTEIVPGKDLDWKPVPLYDGQHQSIAQGTALTSGPQHAIFNKVFEKLMTAASQFWAGGLTQDVIDDRFAEFPLTLPLPPLTGREWGAEATHPDIPLAINTPPLEDERAQAEAKAAEQQPAQNDANSPFGTANPTQGPGPAAGPGGFGPGGFGPGRPGGEFQGVGPGFGPRRMSYGPEGGPGMGGPGMGPGGRMPIGPGGPEGGGAFRGGSGQAASQHTTLPKGVDYYLLRFFDYSVEPGKRYKYRVKLVVHDPNFNMPPTVLAPAVLDRQAKEFQAAKAKGGPNAQKPFYRLVEKWSDPSPTVGIPMAGNVRLAETKVPPPEKFNDEPTVKLLVEAFDVDAAGNPIQAAKEPEKPAVFRRGYVVNLVEDAEYLFDPITIDTQPNFRFQTGMTLLDVDGGTKISKESKDMTVPARILVMGPAGELYIHNELDDKPYVESHRATFEKTTDRQGPIGPGAPGGPGPGRPRPAGKGRG